MPIAATRNKSVGQIRDKLLPPRFRPPEIELPPECFVTPPSGIPIQFPDDFADRLRRCDEFANVRPSLGFIRVKQGRTAAIAQDGGKLPAEIACVPNTRTQP